MYVLTREQKIEIPFNSTYIEISYRYEQRNVETLFFIHGLGCTKDSFDGIWKDRKFDHHSIFTLDLPGFGNSLRPKQFSYKMEDQAEICRLLIEHFRLHNVNLIGHSMGGAISLLLINKIPDTVISFVNLEGNLIGEDCTISRKATKYSLNEFEVTFDDFRSKLQETNKLSRAKHELKFYYELLSRCDPFVFHKSSESLVKWSDSGKLLDMFLGMKTKNWYVYGEWNKNLPSIKLLKSKGVQLVEVPKSGHFMMIGNPEGFNQMLLRLLTRKNV